MQTSDLLSEHSVLSSLRVSGKDHAFEQIARAIGSLHGLDAKRIFQALREREQLGSTGVGAGIAIPHAKLPSLERIVGFFARLEKPIDFAALDEEPVDLMFVLVAPEAAGADHLRALANVARLLRDPVMAEKLRGTTEPTALYTLLVGAERSHAA